MTAKIPQSLGGLLQLLACVVLPFPGAGVREDVFLIWREMEEACNTLVQIQKLVDKTSQSDVVPEDCSRCCLY